MAILASVLTYGIGIGIGCIVGYFSVKRLNRSDLIDAEHAGYLRALDEIKERHKARGRKAAATRQRKAE